MYVCMYVCMYVYTRMKQVGPGAVDFRNSACSRLRPDRKWSASRARRQGAAVGGT